MVKLILIVLIFFVSNLLCCQNPFPHLKENEMVLSYRILAYYKPEYYILHFNVYQISETTNDAELNLVKRIKNFGDSLQFRFGIKPNDIEVHFGGLTPIYSHETKSIPPPIQKPQNFLAHKRLLVKTKKNYLLSEIVAIAYYFDFYDLVSIECYHSSHYNIIDSLRALAIEGLDKKARKIEGLSLDLEDPLITVSEKFNISCLYDYIRENKVDDNEELSLKSNSLNLKTLKKSIMPTKKNNYDLIINGDNMFAGMEAEFELYAKYAMEPNSEVINKSKFYIIDSNGSVKEVALPKR